MVAPMIAAAGIGAAADLAGGLADQYFNQKSADQAWKRQKKVLQNQVSWRVADAVKAGLHPLAALGLSPASGPSATVGSSLGSALSNMGQNVGRAAEAYLTPPDKAGARMALLAEERARLENDLIRSQIAGSQKALLTQGATPGLASPIPETVNRPGAPRNQKFGTIPTRDLQQGQKAEDYAGDMLGSLVAGAGAMEDFVRANWYFDKWNPFTGNNTRPYRGRGYKGR